MEKTSDNLKENYNNEMVFSFWDQVRLWILVRKVKRQKIESLWESNMDKLYYETHFEKMLSYDDASDRQALIDERKKPAAEQDGKKIQELEEQITHAKAVKQAYRKNEQFREEVKSYIKMLDLWMTR